MMLNWSEAVAAGPSVAGGKGYALGRLARYGFRVPEGGVLSAEAYRLAMQDPVRGNAIEHSEPTDLPASVRSSLRDFLSQNQLLETPVAVRSSATAEDSQRASFAGIHRSILGVRGAEAVERAVIACYCSLWTPQARAYRQKMGFRDDEVACAVVVCRMVSLPGSAEPSCAGVAFTADPHTSRRDRVIVEAAAGLGEAVVSGRVTPQRYVFRVEQGTPILDEGPSDSAVLSPEQGMELCFTVWRIHWALGDGQDPQDVEWAHDGSRLWILQARPITHFKRGGPEPLLRLPQYWSTVNLKDSLPGVISELSWSALQEVVQSVAFAALRVAGYHSVDGLELVRRFHGRAYFDITLLLWALYDCFGVPAETSVRTVGGHQPNLPLPPGNPLKGPDGNRRRAASLRLFRALWGFEKKNTPYFRQYMAFMKSLAAEDLISKTTAELKSLFDVIKQKAGEFGPVAGLANTASGRWFTPLEALMLRRFGTRTPALLAALSAGSGDVTSAEHGYRIHDLARIAQSDPEALRWLSSSDLRSWTGLGEGSPFRRAFAGFLEEFGHRAFFEADSANPRWVEDPVPLLQQIRDQAAMKMNADLRQAASQRRLQAEREIRREAPFLWPLIRWMARGLRRGFAIRELDKSALISGVLPVRRIALEIGRRMVDKGQLDRPEQTFDLTGSDLAAWLEEIWDGEGARELALDRRSRRDRWLQEDAPDVIAGEGAASLPDPPPHSPVEAVWRGIPASAGQVTAHARLIREPQAGAALLPGEVLVAPSTDPGWTPLFLRASAVVMETGGYLSHGSIVAREYGLPAVVNLPGVMKQLRDGETLMVNGDEGTVARLGVSSTRER